MGQFGDKFRKAREKKGISLDDVSNVTKISSRMLQAIEEEHFDQLPGGVFNKGFIRAYARHIGLNDEDAVNEYLACLRQAQIDAQSVWEPNTGKRPQVAAHQIAANQAVAGKVSHRVTKSATGQTEIEADTDELPELQLPRLADMRAPRPQYPPRRKSFPWRPVVIALLLLVAVGILWQRRMRHARAEGTALLSPPSVRSSPPAPSPVSQAAANQPSAAQVHSAPATKASTPNRANISPSAKPPAAQKTEEAAQKTEEAAPKTEDADDAAPAIGTASPVPAANVPSRFRLVIHADENSWISVTADGQPVSHETLIAPADASIRANREVVARIGNAAGVSFVWNGQEFQPQGAEAEVKTFVFDENGMHEVPSGQSASPSH